MRKLVGEFEVYMDSGGQWRWRLYASNGQVIAVSGEGYTTLNACKNGMKSTRWNAMFASTNA